MNEKREIVAALKVHNQLCGQLLGLVEGENQLLVAENLSALGDSNSAEVKRALLQRLDESRDLIRQHREALEREGAAGEGLDAEIDRVVEEGKGVIMKAVALDRENEKLLLKHGLLGPGTLPSTRSNRPDLVAKTYFRE